MVRNEKYSADLRPIGWENNKDEKASEKVVGVSLLKSDDFQSLQKR